MNLFDSLSLSKKVFRPISENEVNIYVCGITPNNATHLGHAFTYVMFDVFIRYLKHKGYAINYVQNATDINDSDDVIKQARETGKTWREVADFWIDHFQAQMKTLNVLPPSHYVLATSVIEKIILINKVLIDKGFAYEKNNNVYFDISKDKEYGKLSKLNTEQMFGISKERGNNPNDQNKRNPLDFVLWIASHNKPNWSSPWGLGRPGWHIECTAMIHEYLGEQIDIHGGGHDLIFPHHESEVAQSESYTSKKPFVNFWMHIGMVMYQGEKMSKSLGNLVLVDDLLKKHSGNAVRWMLLSHHYRQPWEFIACDLDEAEGKMQDTLRHCSGQAISKLHEKDRGDFSRVEEYLDDDFDTPEALHYLKNECSGETLKKGLKLLGFVV